MSTEFVLAVDIGASWMGAFLAEDATGRVVARQVWKTDTQVAGNTLGGLQLWGMKQLDSRNGELVGVGVGVAAPNENGVIAETANLPGWEGLNLHQEFRMFHLPSNNCVVVDNDTIMGALGEYARNPQSLGFLALGSGVGWGVLRKPSGKGRVLPEREATEGGHIIIDNRSRVRCGCGAFGCLEALVGGVHLEQRFGCPPGKAHDNQWLPVLKDLAAGICSLAASRSRGLPIYLGGGVMEKQSHRFDLLCELVKMRCGRTTALPPLALATAGSESGLVGAVYAARYLR